MNATQLLTGALAAQLLLAAFTWWPRADPRVEPRPLLPFEASSVTGITVQSTLSNAQPLQLQRGEQGWVIASAHDFPASTDKVQELLDKLAAVRLRRPVATRDVHHAQLRVDEQDASRVLTLQAGEREIKVYAGISGHSKGYVRLADEPTVYEVNLGVWSLRDAPNAYFDDAWVDVPPAELSSWTLTHGESTLALTRDPSGVWTAAGLAPDQGLDPAAVASLLSATLTVRLQGPADPALGDPATAPDAWTVSWRRADAPSTEGYRLLERDGALIGRLDGDLRHVLLPDSLGDAVRGATLAGLVLPSG